MEPSRKPKLLLVEDDESWMLLCSTLLAALGFELKTATNRRDALREIEKEDFDIVLTDLCLPDPQDGKDVVQGVKARHPGTDVILMTASPSLDTAVSILKDGAYDYIIKPFKEDYLKTVLDRCLEKRRSVEELSVEKKLREEVQTAYSELKKVERLKEAFLSRLSHELNTPLAEAQMAVSLLEMQFPDQGKSKKQIQVAIEAVERLKLIVGDLLDFVDLQDPDLRLDKKPVEIEPIFREIETECVKLLGPKRIKIEMDFSGGVSKVHADPRLIKRAFRQLFLNAIHFNQQEGTIRIIGKDWDKWVFVHVQDQGEGVPKEKAGEIFDSFYQIADYMTRTVGGLGLGLAITKRIIEAHKGSISVDSKVGEGTDFKVCLPKIGENGK